MNRRLFDGTSGPATWLLAAVGVLVVGGGIAWMVAEDGDSEPGFTAAGKADALPPPDTREPFGVGAEGQPPRGSDRPRDRGDSASRGKRSVKHSDEPASRGPSDDRSKGEGRDETKPAPDIERLIEDGLDGRGGEESRDRPPARIRNLLRHGFGDGGDEASSGPPPELEDAFEEIAGGG